MTPTTLWETLFFFDHQRSVLFGDHDLNPDIRFQLGLKGVFDWHRNRISDEKVNKVFILKNLN